MAYQSQDQVHVSEAAMIAPHDLSAHELSTAYRTRRLSPVEVTRAVLSRIDAWEKRINAMYVIDAAGALAMAAASQERWRWLRLRTTGSEWLTDRDLKAADELKAVLERMKEEAGFGKPTAPTARPGDGAESRIITW